MDELCNPENQPEISKTRLVQTGLRHLIKSTHPVDIHIAFRNDVGMEEGGFTGCGEIEGEGSSVPCLWEERSVTCDTVHALLHAGKPTATITSVCLEVSEADGGS